MRRIIMLFFLMFVTSVSAIPQFPMIINGEVTVDDKPAKTGTIISAKVNDKEISSYKVIKEGYYSLAISSKEGEIIDIYVNNKKAGSTTFSSGVVENLVLNTKSLPPIYIITFIFAIAIIGYYIVKFFIKKNKGRK